MEYRGLGLYDYPNLDGCVVFILNVQVLEWLIRLVCKTNDESPRRFESDPELNKIQVTDKVSVRTPNS